MCNIIPSKYKCDTGHVDNPILVLILLVYMRSLTGLFSIDRVLTVPGMSYHMRGVWRVWMWRRVTPTPTTTEGPSTHCTAQSK